MFTATQIVGLKSKGLSMVEIGQLTGKADYDTIHSLLGSEGMTKEEVMDYLKNVSLSQVSKPKGKQSAAREALENPKVIHTSAGVILSEVNFGGTGITVKDWKGLPTLQNQGTGKGISNGMFIVLSKLDDGKVDPVETYAQLELVNRLFDQHKVGIEEMKKWCREKAETLGIIIPAE